MKGSGRWGCIRGKLLLFCAWPLVSLLMERFELEREYLYYSGMHLPVDQSAHSIAFFCPSDFAPLGSGLVDWPRPPGHYPHFSCAFGFK